MRFSNCCIEHVGLSYDISRLQANGGKAKMNICSTSERKGADTKKSDVKDKPQHAQGHKVLKTTSLATWPVVCLLVIVFLCSCSGEKRYFGYTLSYGLHHFLVFGLLFSVFVDLKDFDENGFYVLPVYVTM